MNFTRIHSRVASVSVSASIGSRSTWINLASKCAHRDPDTIVHQCQARSMTSHTAHHRLRNRTRTSLLNQRSIHSGDSARHINTKPATRDASNESPLNTQTHITTANTSRIPRHNSHHNTRTPASSAAALSSPIDTSFIPDMSALDPETDYWKFYQAFLDNRQPVTNKELYRLSQWLTHKGVTKDIATKVMLLMKEIHKRPSMTFITDVYNDLIFYHIKRGKFQDAQKILDLMTQERQSKNRSFDLNQRALALLLAMHIKSGNEAEVVALKEREHNGLDLHMDQFLKWTRGLQLTGEQIGQVKEIFREIQDQRCPPNTKRFTHWMTSHFHNKKPETAIALLNHILDIGFSVNKYTASCVVSGLLKAGLYDDAIGVWNKIKHTDARNLDIAILNPLLNALCQDPKRFAMARELWAEILQDSQLKPDAFSFSTMMNGYFRAMDPISAMNLWELMQKEPFSVQLNPVLFNVALTGLFHNHQPDRAKELYQQMCAMEGMEVTLGTYDTMVRGLLSVQDLTELDKVLKRMENTGKEPSTTTYTIITDTLFSQHDAVSAIKVAELMTSMNVPKTAVTYSAVVAGLANAGELDRAMELYQEMQRAGYPPSIHTYGSLIQGALKSGNTTMAEEMAQLAKTRIKDGLSPGAYSILITGYANLMMMDQAEHWFMEMRQSLSSGSGNNNQDRMIPWTVYYVLLRSCVEHNLWSPAERVVTVMKELGFHSTVPKLNKLLRKVERARPGRL
ncbi:hypothetical protein BG011_000809 [Mortierella polycephala]|uniref:Pentacotripeptide-repeat region of PRORP domain-containing protein n=1 Tax=Mortierella polycephala TaxID=41804 RepID=A0A9P6PKT0_9FUNG|nr:hypothetical protein BG011_000809 [Mortierella polycephala]